MTPARKAALQWFFDLGEVGPSEMADPSAPTYAMHQRMAAHGQIEGFFGATEIKFRLTDKGRRDLHEAAE